MSTGRDTYSHNLRLIDVYKILAAHQNEYMGELVQSRFFEEFNPDEESLIKFAREEFDSDEKIAKFTEGEFVREVVSHTRYPISKETKYTTLDFGEDNETFYRLMKEHMVRLMDEIVYGYISIYLKHLRVKQVFLKVYRDSQSGNKDAQSLLEKFYQLSQEKFLIEASKKGYHSGDKTIHPIVLSEEEMREWLKRKFLPVSYGEILERLGIPNKKFLYVIDVEPTTQKFYNNAAPSKKDSPDSVFVQTTVLIPKNWGHFLLLGDHAL